MTDDSEKTVFLAFHAVAADSRWAVYRVRTKNGQYSLGLYRGEGHRKLAVLTNVRFARSADEMREAQDSAPLIGGRSLFAVPYGEWIGSSIEVGAIRTSPVVSVDPETDPHVVEEVSRVSTHPRGNGAARARPPYPEREVELAEGAAQMLYALYAKHDLFADVRSNPDLEQRLRTSLETCGLMLRALAGRGRSP